MDPVPSPLRRHAKGLAAIVLVLPLYVFAREPSLAPAERADLARRFHFERRELPDVSSRPHQSVRAVHPSLAHIAGWISTLGAAIALNDLDRDGLSNDVVWVDTRVDQVLIGPVPGTGERYAPFALDPAPLAYDARTTAPMGCVPADIDEDGRVDLLVYYWGRSPIAFLCRKDFAGDRPLALTARSYVACEVFTPVERWYTNAAFFADLDGDGHANLVLGNYFQDGARILDETATGSEELQDSMTRAFNGGRNRLLLWSGAPAGSEAPLRFVDASDALDEHVAHAWTLAAGAVDLDDDLLPEIYFANDFGPDRLLHNRSSPGQLVFANLEGVKHLTTPSSKVLGRDSFKGMGVDFGDLDGDGRYDIYVSNITTEYGLQESQFAWVNTGDVAGMQSGRAPFDDASEPLGLARSGWGWDSRIVDFDGDGVPEAMQALGFLRGTTNRWPELHEIAMGNDQLLRFPSSWHRFLPGDDLSGHTPNPFFVRAADGRYCDLARDVGLATVENSRGIAIADADGDGRLDFALGVQYAPSAVYMNRAPAAGEFLGLHLCLPSGGEARTETLVRAGHPGPLDRAHAAIGAQVRVASTSGRSLRAVVDGGSGHSGKRGHEIVFGLGSPAAREPLEVEIAWRDTRGRPQHATFALAPGWHTLILGAGGTRE